MLAFRLASRIFRSVPTRHKSKNISRQQKLVVPTKRTFLSDGNKKNFPSFQLAKRLGTRPEQRIISERKTFPVNGRIHPAAREAFFFVDPTESNQEIIEKVSKRPGGRTIMLHGARGIGKSTRVSRLVEQLSENFFCISISLHKIEVELEYHEFWNSFGRAINRAHPKLPQIQTASEFRDLLTPSNQEEHFEGKPVVMFVDEFDLLYSSSKEVLDSILGVFQDLKEEYGQTSCLYALVGVGPFSILRLTGQSLSRLNVSDALSAQPFTKEETVKLFQEYSENMEVLLDPRIVDDIYSQTNGHAALTCFCGKQLDEVLLRGKSSVTFEEWIAFYVEHLIPNLRSSWITMARLVDAILERPEICAALLQHFLRSNSEHSVGHSLTLLQHAEFLTSEGVLVRKEGTTDVFKFASPLVRRLILWALREFNSGRIPNRTVPEENNILLIPELIKMALPCFNATRMREAPRLAGKKACNRGTRRDLEVPNEACYHFELFNVLASWMSPLGYEIYTEVKASPSETSNSSKRCDLFVWDKEQRYALELMASSEEFERHTGIAKISKEALKAQHAWVLNFFTSESEIQTFPVVPTEDVKILHICHDREWTWAQICLNGSSPELINLTKVGNLQENPRLSLGQESF